MKKFHKNFMNRKRFLNFIFLKNGDHKRPQDDALYDKHTTSYFV